MKIKNTKELRLRAASHVRDDHVIQGTYGDVTRNGHVTFKGCAIGCLSTPHRKAEMLKFLEEHSGPYGGLSISNKDQRGLLATEFGINRALAMTAEGFFEAQLTHGAAIQFVKEFADSLVEGSELTPSDVLRWLKSNLKLTGLEANVEGNVTFYDEVDYALKHRGNEPLHPDSEELEERVGSLTEKFLGWLRSRKPATS